MIIKAQETNWRSFIHRNSSCICQFASLRHALVKIYGIGQKPSFGTTIAKMTKRSVRKYLLGFLREKGKTVETAKTVEKWTRAWIWYEISELLHFLISSRFRNWEFVNQRSFQQLPRGSPLKRICSKDLIPNLLIWRVTETSSCSRVKMCDQVCSLQGFLRQLLLKKLVRIRMGTVSTKIHVFTEKKRLMRNEWNNNIQ